jgi:hypothetical protein
MNYAELTQAIQDYLENSETKLVSQIPTFVRQTEERIFRSVLIPELRTHATAPTAIGNRYLSRPTDFLAPFSMAAIGSTGGYNYLLEKDVDFIREAYSSPAITGIPKYYAQFNGDTTSGEGNFLLGPTPDAIYTVELHYYYDPPSIVDTGTSWLGTNAESLLLYGCLLEAYTVMKGDADLLQTYERKYQEALAQLGGLARRTETDTYRKG